MSAKKKKKAKVHKEIDGLNVYIDEFGGIKMNKTLDELNTFLDKHVEDKKLKSQDSSKKKDA